MDGRRLVIDGEANLTEYVEDLMVVGVNLNGVLGDF